MTLRATAAAALIAAACIIGLGAAGAQPPDIPAQPPSFRAGVDVVSLNVTVTDREGRFVTDLDESSFRIYEDGVQQDINFFTRTQLPIALALLIDTSASMDEKMATAQEAAIGFAQRLRPEDLAEIVDFDGRVNILQPFTNDVEQLERAIQRTAAGGSTSLYNAIYIALRELAKAPLREADLRREAIIVLSDGEDTSSLVSFDEVLELSKRSNTAIFSIGLQSDDSRSRTGFREADFVLRQLAQETGGRAFFPERIE
ncbi:MAG: VWA domain-containing protein, partial [Acidobacteria bacterium]|nr:VWA domain-containing protein [Acidobacteriota bacterium]